MSKEFSADTPSSIRVVLDTSVLVSSAFFGIQAEYVFRLLREQKLLGFASLSILDELNQKIIEKTDWDDHRRSAFLNYLLTTLTIVVPTKITAPKLRDPGDLHVLGTAVAAETDLLITTDQDLLAIKRFGEIRIVHPKTLRWMFPPKTETDSRC